jgi:hypothetical protein
MFIAGAAKGFSDKLVVWYNSVWRNLPKTNWFYKWAAGGSWKNKWKLDSEGNIIPNANKLWYYLWLYKPHSIEKFPYSSTFLVLFTDGWHTGQFLMRTAFMFAAIFYFQVFGLAWYFQYIIMSVCYMIGFTLTYDYILKKR